MQNLGALMRSIQRKNRDLLVHGTVYSATFIAGITLMKLENIYAQIMPGAQTTLLRISKTAQQSTSRAQEGDRAQERRNQSMARPQSKLHQEQNKEEKATPYSTAPGKGTQSR